MGTYTRKDGTKVVTKAVYNAAMNKQGISKLVQIVPPNPVFESRAGAVAIASFLGADFMQSLIKRSRESAESNVGRS
ncbi:hypothetical protein P3G55_24770 [Leptospira sp. 96542]|nr:hypothetical protein [Leptospira sp. 96542]